MRHFTQAKGIVCVCRANDADSSLLKSDLPKVVFVTVEKYFVATSDFHIYDCFFSWHTQLWYLFDDIVANFISESFNFFHAFFLCLVGVEFWFTQSFDFRWIVAVRLKVLQCLGIKSCFEVGRIHKLRHKENMLKMTELAAKVASWKHGVKPICIS